MLFEEPVVCGHHDERDEALREQLAQYLHDHHRLLSYYLASRGFPVPDDLPGIDRPDLVDALVREVYGWAGLSVPR